MVGGWICLGVHIRFGAGEEGKKHDTFRCIELPTGRAFQCVSFRKSKMFDWLNVFAVASWCNNSTMKYPKQTSSEVKRAVCVGCNYPSKPYGLAGSVQLADRCLMTTPIFVASPWWRKMPGERCLFDRRTFGRTLRFQQGKCCGLGTSLLLPPFPVHYLHSVPRISKDIHIYTFHMQRICCHVNIHEMMFNLSYR